MLANVREEYAFEVIGPATAIATGQDYCFANHSDIQLVSCPLRKIASAWAVLLILNSHGCTL